MEASAVAVEVPEVCEAARLLKLPDPSSLCYYQEVALLVSCNKAIDSLQRELCKPNILLASLGTPDSFTCSAIAQPGKLMPGASSLCPKNWLG